MTTAGLDAHQQLLFGTLQRLLQIQGTDLQSLLTEVTNLIVETLPSDKVDIFLYDPTVSTLIAVGTSQTPLGFLQKSLGLDRLPVANGGRTVEVFQTGKSYLNGQVEKDMGVVLGVREALGVRSMILVGLYVAGERRGVLSLTTQQHDAYDENDLRFCEAVAQWIGVMVHRAELVAQVSREAAAQTRRLVAEELVQILAHDLKNQITPLSLRLRLIQRRADRQSDPDMRRDAEEALRAVNYLRAVIDNLLDDARLTQGIFTLNYEQVDVSALAQEIIAMMATPEMNIRLDAPMPCYGMLDGARIRQVFENLVGNALKHTPSGTQILISVICEQQDGLEWINVKVKDTGPGIDATILPTLFSRFGTSNQAGGLGLGLYLVSSIAKAHGGDLTVSSIPQGGTTFEMRLPVVPPLSSP